MKITKKVNTVTRSTAINFYVLVNMTVTIKLPEFYFSNSHYQRLFSISFHIA